MFFFFFFFFLYFNIILAHQEMKWSAIKSENPNQTITVVTSSVGNLESLGTTEIISGALPASAVSFFHDYDDIASI
jgi:hypothetical protein